MAAAAAADTAAAAAADTAAAAADTAAAAAETAAAAADTAAAFPDPPDLSSRRTEPLLLPYPLLNPWTSTPLACVLGVRIRLVWWGLRLGLPEVVRHLVGRVAPPEAAIDACLRGRTWFPQPAQGTSFVFLELQVLAPFSSVAAEALAMRVPRRASTVRWA